MARMTLITMDLVKDARERPVSVNLSGANKLELVVENGGDGANGDWGIWFDPAISR